ncbi:Ger(x)C family spore germination protein [Paenibacillus sp. N3.4]|uniref:Ger(x)C family spore germination protein n=1 Tax=Paenibacillus sp. N3.4 TaxID=2603222 RepID=UPI0011C9C2F7|nr:Ger(x)C family spore germination protein [Paenibacillus sp. N3.4]TXK77361.1 Ger(x)C family spore germination protein [Paenibacillus sp. N3.4]
MKAARGICMLSCMILLFPITGCWDRVEIEDVGIVLGIGFDKPSEDMKEPSQTMAVQPIQGKNKRISMMHHFAIPKHFAAKEGGLALNNYINIVSEGDAVFDNINRLSSRLSRIPSYEHLRIIVISGELAKTFDLQNMINFLLRNTETRRTIRVMISEGKTSDIFQKKGIDSNPALKLRGMAEEFHKTLLIPPLLELGDMSENLTGKKSFIIQRVVTFGKENKLAGAAVIKGDQGRMIGWIGEKEVVGLNWLKGGNKQTGITKGVDPKSGERIVYEVRTIKSTIVPKVEAEQISFEVNIQTEGRLREDWAYPGNALEESFVKRAEQATEVSIKKSVETALAKTQKEYKVDVINFGKKLEIKYPKVWKQIKDDWDTTFSMLPIKVNVKVKIIEFGIRGTKKG